MDIPTTSDFCGRSTTSGKGCLGNGETPTGERGRRDPGVNEVSEEARQLARGKRVVPQTPLALNIITAQSH